MGWFTALKHDWAEGMNAFKNIIGIAMAIGVLGFFHPLAGLLIAPAAVFVGIMNAATQDSSIAAFIIGLLFSLVLFGITFGIGVGAGALFGS